MASLASDLQPLKGESPHDFLERFYIFQGVKPNDLEGKLRKMREFVRPIQPLSLSTYEAQFLRDRGYKI